MRGFRAGVTAQAGDRLELFTELLVPRYPLVSTLESPGRPIPTDVIGILDRFDLAKTLEMARHLQPDARRVRGGRVRHDVGEHCPARSAPERGRA